ncbi:MAG: NIPSNAP family protein [Acidobacteriota bacterium]|nr:NIPSNAP family protein [Acidobacteriota bacterium]
MKHGAEFIAAWQRLDDPETLVWMLAYRDRAHRTEVWQGFAADPAWEALRNKYPVGVSIEAYMMSATDYSALK